MRARSPHWVNSTVMVEALQRYEQNLLPRSMRLWVEAMLDIDPSDSAQPLLPSQQDPSQL